MLTRWKDWSNWPGLEFHTLATPWSSFGDLRREMERVFYDFERGLGVRDERFRGPRITVSENESSVNVRVPLPGVNFKDVELTVTGNSLTLRAKRELRAPEGYAAHRRERSSFEFADSFELPCKVDAERVDAQLKNGILNVTLPKSPEAQPKRIAVKS